MDINQLNAFLTVAEELNFRKAADRLHMSQPPLTRLISKLEDDLGVKLFNRSTRKVELTGAGLALLNEGREIMDKLAEAEKAVRDIGKLKTGHIEIAFSAPAFYSSLPKLAWNFKDRFAKVKLSVNELNHERQLQALKAGKIDVGFMEGPVEESKNLSALMVADQELGLLVSENHRLASRKKVKISELAEETVIFHARSERPGFHDGLLNFFKSNQIKINIRYRDVGESCAILVAMEKGLLLSVGLGHGTSTPGTVFVPIEKPPKLGVYAVWNPNNPSLELKSFLNFVRENSAIKDPKVDCLMGLASW
ncbi:HTH-type transcriptional regulator CatM [compost metagenome]